MSQDLLTPIRRAQDLFDSGEAVITVTDGNSVLLVAMGAIRFTVVPTSGATVTISKVDSPSATSHDTDTTETITAETTYDISWPYYLISTADEDMRVGVV